MKLFIKFLLTCSNDPVYCRQDEIAKSDCRRAALPCVVTQRPKIPRGERAVPDTLTRNTPEGVRRMTPKSSARSHGRLFSFLLVQAEEDS